MGKEILSAVHPQARFPWAFPSSMCKLPNEAVISRHPNLTCSRIHYIKLSVGISGMLGMQNHGSALFTSEKGAFRALTNIKSDTFSSSSRSGNTMFGQKASHKTFGKEHL